MSLENQTGLLSKNNYHNTSLISQLELNDHCGPFQPRPFYDSMNIRVSEIKLASLQGTICSLVWHELSYLYTPRSPLHTI